MKVVFNGTLEVASGGCVPCGHRKASKRVMVTRKRYILPSGSEVVFRLGRPVSVSDADGAFLLDFTYTDANGIEQSVFSEV